MIEQLEQYVKENSPDPPAVGLVRWEMIVALLEVAKAAADLPWLKRGLYIDVDGMPGLGGPSKDKRLLRLQDAVARLEGSGGLVE